MMVGTVARSTKAFIMDLSCLSQLQKDAKKSFGDHKSIIKRVLAGKTVLCKECQQPIQFAPVSANAPANVSCAKGCTQIELDMS